MTTFRTVRDGDGACALVSPFGALVRLGRSAEGDPTGACLAIEPSAAAAFLAMLEERRRRAVRAASARFRRLPPGLRARLGALRETPVLTETGCAACRSLEAPAGFARLCVLAAHSAGLAAHSSGLAAHSSGLAARSAGLAPGGGPSIGAEPEAPARLLLRPFHRFVAASGEGGLGLALLGVRSEASPCACS